MLKTYGEDAFYGVLLGLVHAHSTTGKLPVPTPDTVKYIDAFELFLLDKTRESLSYLFLSRASMEDIAKTMDIELQLLIIYREFFFDTTQLTTKIDYLTYAEFGEPPYRRSKAIQAVENGLDFVRMSMGLKTEEVNSVSLLQNVIAHSYTKFVDRISKAGNSEEDFIAINYMKAITQGVVALEKIKRDSNTDNLPRIFVELTQPAHNYTVTALELLEENDRMANIVEAENIEEAKKKNNKKGE